MDVAASQRARTPRGSDAEDTATSPGGRVHIDGGAARVQTSDGASVLLHSARDPLGEARAQLSIVDAVRPHAVVIVGAGLGFLTEAARERWPDAAIVVVEPLRALADAARARTPALYTSARVSMTVGPDYEGAAALWRVFDTPDAPSPSTGIKPPIVVHPVLVRAMPAEIVRATRVARRAIDAAQMNARAREENAGRYLLNTLRNAAHIVHGADPARLRGRFSRVPAIIVGAGPSLDDNIEALRAFGNRALVIAADTAWRPLVAAGIDPHLVIALDPTAANGRHLTGVRARRDTWVLAEGSVDPEALRPLAGRVGVFRVGTHHPWPWLQSLGVERPLVRAWGSVLTSAYDLAVICDCDPVVFVGSDLSFTHGRPYCRGTSMEDDWARYAALGANLRQIWENTLTARTLLTEPGLDGHDVRTAPHLVEFRNWLVARASETPARRVINATGAGIFAGPRVEQADLATALEAHGNQDATLRDRIRALFLDARATPPAAQVLEALGRVQEQTDADALPTAPIPEWLAFGRPSLTQADIRGAAATGGAELGRVARGEPAAAPGPQPVDAGVVAGSRWFLADRVAAMRAAITGDRAMLEGCTPRDHAADPGLRERAAREAAGAIDALLALPRLTRAVDDRANEPADPNMPLSYRFRWTADAAALVSVLEEGLLDADRGAPRAESRATTNGNDYWTGVTVPLVHDPEEAATSAADPELAARLTLIAQRLALLDLEPDADAPTRRRRERLVDATRRGLSDPRCAPTATRTPLRLPGCATALLLPLRIDALMRALTGTVARRAANVEPRLCFASEGIGHCEPTILTDQGLPRGWALATAPDDHALFTPGNGDRGVRIGPDGGLEPGRLWPDAITGEMPWGVEGGALAWNTGTSTLLLKERADAAPIVERVPFTPKHAAVGADGSTFWGDDRGGLWEWLPGRSGRHLLDAPSPSILRFDGADLVLAPIPRDAQGRISRRRLPYEWRYDGATRQLRETRTGPEGQCAKVARRGVWTAGSHPFCDLIRLDDGQGLSLLLACYAPLGVAWAGPSLVVTTGEGIVLFFPRLLDLVGSLGAGPALAFSLPA